MSTNVKREREWEASSSVGGSAAPSADLDAKRPRLDAPSSLGSNATLPGANVPVSTSLQPSQATQPHPTAVLDAIRARLQATKDPHLQARLLLQYSASAASPGAKTAAAIDFLFSFLQQNQNQNRTDTQTDGNQKDNSSGSGAIVVGAIVRGLRQLLAAKPAVVEPMIQVDAMGEQLMQCMSVGEDFKLRRDMMRIVVDCLMLTTKYKQVETLLKTCVQDHDVGMQAICLKGYLRLHDAGRCFASGTSSVEEHFDRLATFVLFSQSEEIRVLAARVLVALADLHPRIEIADSKLFSSSEATIVEKTPLLLPEKAFYILCMAGSDSSELVRVEIARCMRRFSRVLLSEVVEHAVGKTQIDEAVADVAPDVVAMNTRLMMSSGVLLSLLEDINDEVAVEASRTIARLSEVAISPDAGNGRWSQRSLERVITAHFDVLPRASTSSTPQVCHVLVDSLQRLLVCRYTFNLKSDFSISTADMNWLMRVALSQGDDIKSGVVGVLLVLLHCDLASTWSVQRVFDFLVEAVSMPSFKCFETYEGEEDKITDYWAKRLLDVVGEIGKKCAKVLQVDVSLADRVQEEASRQRNGRHCLLQNVCRALLGKAMLPHGERVSTDKSTPKSIGNLFFLTKSTTQKDFDRPTPTTSTLEVLRTPPTDEDTTKHLKAVQRLRAAFPKDDLEISYRVAEILVHLRQHVKSFPEATAAPTPTAHSYVSMEAMLSTSPSVSSTHTSKNGVSKVEDEATKAFASLHLPAGLHKSCQEMHDFALDTYIKAFALSSASRTELLQLILFGRMGLVLAELQGCTSSLQTTNTIRSIVQDATRLRFLFSDNQDQTDSWFPRDVLGDIKSLNDLKRAFVAVTRKAWPSALVEAAIGRSAPSEGDVGVRHRRLAVAHSSIQEPSISTNAKAEPREITANWPFEQRVRFLLTHARDITQIYIKSALPNGDIAYHHVPVSQRSLWRSVSATQHCRAVPSPERQRHSFSQRFQALFVFQSFTVQARH
ncbi:hypothetical protein PHYBOEH_011266 [Phytophthora boehmeriae]|uniref:Uncharacterized protein n=1 Tax=Phytophthora boehmeriae TaxID=109152 RepID=A0A8T1X1K0_9STRA|nr:hypothetical protein PHYBOEH_011266 [Phytophthora boehmeriae]